MAATSCRGRGGSSSSSDFPVMPRPESSTGSSLPIRHHAVTTLCHVVNS